MARARAKKKAAAKRQAAKPVAQETIEEKKKRARAIVARLRKKYPGARTALNFNTPFELLVATILSAQCTDERVNKVTPGLFAKYPTPEAFASADFDELAQDIRSTGFFRNKAKAIIESAKIICEKFGGEMPETMEGLLQLHGVSRKTANVVLGNALGKATGVVVDTHVHRLALRMGLTQWRKRAQAEKVEQDLMELLPKKDWIFAGNALILHGRDTCTAREARCAECIVADLCPQLVDLVPS